MPSIENSRKLLVTYFLKLVAAAYVVTHTLNFTLFSNVLPWMQVAPLFIYFVAGGCG